MSQKVIKIGSSLGVTIPKKQLKEMNIVVGDEVDMTIRKKVNKNKHEKLLVDLENFMETYKKDLQNLADR